MFAHTDASFTSNLDGVVPVPISVGWTHNTPFVSSAKAQIDVATCQMTAEYYSASDCCKALINFRQLSTDLAPLSCS